MREGVCAEEEEEAIEEAHRMMHGVTISEEEEEEEGEFEGIFWEEGRRGGSWVSDGGR